MTVLQFPPRKSPILLKAIARLGGCCILTTFALNHGAADEQRAMKEQLFDRALAVVMLLVDEVVPEPAETTEEGA